MVPKMRTTLLVVFCAVMLGASAQVSVASGPRASAGAATRTYVLQKCTVPRYKPTTLVTTCGSGNFAYEHLRWSRWTRRAAKARGTVAIRRTGAFDGGIFHIPVVLRLSRPRQCDASGRMVFTRERYRLLESFSGTARTGSDSLFTSC